MKLQDLRGKLRVGMKVKETRGGNASACAALCDGKEATITRVSDSMVWFSNCDHPWGADIDLVPPIKSRDTLEIGDTIVNENGDKAKVLAVIGETFLMSDWSCYKNWKTTAGGWCHIEEAQRDGWKIEGQEEQETVEMSVREVAEKLNIAPDKLKIVKD